MDVPRCARHPDVETRLTCSACGTPICPDCAVEAAISYQCPDCATARGQQLPGAEGSASGGSVLSRWLSPRGPSGRDEPAQPSEPADLDASDRDAADPHTSDRGASDRDASDPEGELLPTAIGVKATAAGIGAAVLGGLLLGPILVGGAFFLLSAGVIGWGVARLVVLAGEGHSSPYLRALAMTASGFAVAIGLAVAGAGALPSGLLALAYPAAVYGGWVVVRQR